MILNARVVQVDLVRCTIIVWVVVDVAVVNKEVAEKKEIRDDDFVMNAFSSCHRSKHG